MEGKMTINKEGKKTQFRWNKLMSRALLQVLAEEVRKGSRPNNTFRVSSFDLAAKYISERFNVKCTPDNVNTHLKTVQSAWFVVSMVWDNSGFGWDVNLKMITTPPNVYDDYIEKHLQCEKYLNKKIEMYEEMSIVVGKDVARGNFAKSFAKIEVDSTTEPNKICDNVDASRSESDTSSQQRPHRKRSRVDDENMEVQLIHSQIGEVASVLHKLACQKLDVSELYDEIMKTEGFDDVFLVGAFDYLVVSEQLAKVFLVKNDRLRKIWLESFGKNG